MAARKDYAARKAAAPVQAQPEKPAAEVLTVNGQPIPDHLLHAIPYANTDQGRAELNAKLIAEGRVDPSLPRVTVLSSEWDKRLQRMEDGKDGVDPWDHHDPVEAAKSQVLNPEGKSFHLLGDRTVDRNGLRGFMPERNKRGELIKVGNMVLASVPEEVAKRRERRCMNRAIENEQSARENTFADQARLAGQGVGPLKPSDTVTDYQTGETVTIGNQRSVGEAGAILAGA